MVEFRGVPQARWSQIAASHRRFQCRQPATQAGDNFCRRGGGKRNPARKAKATSKHEAHRVSLAKVGVSQGYSSENSLTALALAA